MPVGDGDVAGVAEAAESGNAMDKAVRNSGRGHEMFDGVDGADGDCSLERREGVHFLPEADGVAEFPFGDGAQPRMMLAQNERKSFGLEAGLIALENCTADIFALQREFAAIDGKVGADGEADQIDRVRHGPCFVEIVDAPDEAALDVAPGAEVLDVQIADGENFRGLGELGTNLRPKLRPAVVSGAEEREEFFLHASVFEAKISLFEVSSLAEPGLKVAGGFDDVHAGNNSGGVR